MSLDINNDSFWANRYGPIQPTGLPTEEQKKQIKDYIQKIEEKYPEEVQEPKKYNHYFKDVSNLKYIDIYRVLDLWDVTNPCLQHAAKKIIAAGNRGHKDVAKDVQEAIDSLIRWQDMQEEDND